MSALLRGVLGLLAETLVWCGLVLAVATLVILACAVVRTPRNPRRALVAATIAAALTIGVADRAGLPPLWQVGLHTRLVPVVWSAIGAAMACAAILVRESSAGNR